MTPRGKRLIVGSKNVSGTVAAGLARGLFDFAVTKGAEPTKLADAAGVRIADLADQDRRVRYSSYVALMHAAKRLTGDPALALRFGDAVDMAQMSIVGLIGTSCGTVAEGLAQMNRYSKLVVDVGLGERHRLQRDADGIWFIHENPDADFPELTESAFARIARGARTFTKLPVLKAVHFRQKQPVYRAAFDEIFPVPVTFGSDKNAILGDAGILEQPVALQPRYVFGILSERADALMQQLENSKTTRGRVEGLLVPILHTGGVSIDKVAPKLGMSRWTLARKLKAENVTFERVLDELRRRMALDYLAAGKVSVNEAAYLCGFSESAAFSRAVKRWTGRTPTDVSRSAIGI